MKRQEAVFAVKSFLMAMAAGVIIYIFFRWTLGLEGYLLFGLPIAAILVIAVGNIVMTGHTHVIMERQHDEKMELSKQQHTEMMELMERQHAEMMGKP